MLVTMSNFSILTAQSPFLDDYKLKWQNVKEYTLEFAQIYDYTPTKVEMTYREQLKHIAGNMVWLCSSFLDGDKNYIDPTKTGDSKKEIIAMLEKAFAYADKTIGSLTEKDLDEKVEFIAGEMTRRRIMFLMTDHITHHRGQLVVYLRLNNIEPPSYRGW
jgi:uncharacterized damage-inducible protein DinB